MQIILTGNEKKDIQLLLLINRGMEIVIGEVVIPPRHRQSSHHKTRVIKAYKIHSAEVAKWNMHSRADDPANRRLLAYVR